MRNRQVLERIVIDEENTLDNPETKNVENEERTNYVYYLC